MAYPLSHQGYLPISTSAAANPDSLISGDTGHLASTNAPTAEGAPQAPASRIQKRRTSKVHTGKSLSRSTSTPHLKATGDMSDSEDKKRNKLGYQRISIACAHCRRRKIRCLLAEGDPGQRCQNCIRLKKECVFYPVDQQSVIDQNRSQSSTKSANPSSGVSPSPPELGSGRPFERARQFGSFPSLPSNAPSAYHGMTLEPGSAVSGQGDFAPMIAPNGMSDLNVGRMPPNEYGYPSALENTRSFQTAQEHASHHMSSPSQVNDPAQQAYWRSNAAGQATDFATFPNHSSLVQSTPQDAPYTFSPPESHSWSSSSQPSTRSMSYSNPSEGLQHGYIPAHLSYQQHHLQAQHPATYPPLDISRASMQPVASGPNSAPVGTPVVPYIQSHHYMFQPQGALTASPMPTQHGYPGTWYQDSPTFSHHQHELDSQQSPARGAYTTRPPQ